MTDSASYFFCGIGGSGMLPLALILKGMGADVSGSDRSRDQGRTPEKFAWLESLGFRLFPQDGSGIVSADQVLVASAACRRDEIGSDTHPGTKAKLREMGIPFTKRAAVQLTRADYDRYDYIVAMDEENLRDIPRITGSDTAHKVRLLLSFAGEQREVADPWYTGNFTQTYEDVRKGCEALLLAIHGVIVK